MTFRDEVERRVGRSASANPTAIDAFSAGAVHDETVAALHVLPERHVVIDGRRYEVVLLTGHQVAKRRGQWRMSMTSDAWMDGHSCYRLVPVENNDGPVRDLHICSRCRRSFSTRSEWHAHAANHIDECIPVENDAPESAPRDET